MNPQYTILLLEELFQAFPKAICIMLYPLCKLRSCFGTLLASLGTFPYCRLPLQSVLLYMLLLKSIALSFAYETASSTADLIAVSSHELYSKRLEEKNLLNALPLQFDF